MSRVCICNSHKRIPTPRQINKGQRIYLCFWMRAWLKMDRSSTSLAELNPPLQKVPWSKAGNHGQHRGTCFSFQHWRDTLRMRERKITLTHCGWNKSPKYNSVFSHFTCKILTPREIPVQKTESEELFFPLSDQIKRQMWITLSRIDVDLLIGKLR